MALSTTDNLRFYDVSLVPIDEVLIERVAERCKVPGDRVRAYIADKNDQNDELLRAFLFFGVGPINKSFTGTVAL